MDNHILAPGKASGCVVLNSNLSPGAAEALRLTLLESIDSGTNAGHAEALCVRLDASHVEQLSTASLQVLLAAARQLQTKGKQLLLENPSARFVEWVRLSGAPQGLLGCGLTASKAGSDISNA